MAATDRQNRLLIAEDWAKVYQSFRNAEFKSYDFDNLRRTMINYIRQNYPEDFNDYIESSEYLALIDLIAFLGQNVAFRVDLNARENFLELASRRESVLRLARLLSYNPKRNKPANGLLKMESASTSEDILDSNGTNLSNQGVIWNDPSNSNWREQFERVLNAALPSNSQYGKPIKKDKVEGVPTDQYRFNASNTDVPVYTFSKNVDGRSLQFQIVSTDVSNGIIAEEAPLPGNSLGFLYRDDGRGPGSTNSGFFAHFRQGTLDSGIFNIDTPSTNQTVSIDATNVNNEDVWLYKLNSIGAEDQLWTKVDAVEGNNIVYNSTRKNQRNIYAVLTKVQDSVDMIFSDGTFGNLPKGQFKAFFRTSANDTFNVVPKDLTNISVTVPYTSKAGNAEILNLVFSLKYTVDNSSRSESNASIKANAPATYYTQNRMVTGEDYQVAPLGVSQEIIKVKTVNRTASGISRYYDLLDATGKYSNTSLFGTDGLLYKELTDSKESFTFSTRTDVEGTIENTITPILSKTSVINYYLDKFPKVLVSDLQASWSQSSTSTNYSTGKFLDSVSSTYQVGTFTGSGLRFVEPGSLIKFVAPVGQYFAKDGTLGTGNILPAGTKTYVWTKVISVVTDGRTDNTDGSGPIAFNDVIPTGAVLSEIRPKFSKALVLDVKTQIIDQIFAYKTFGLRYDTNLRQWRLITENNLDITSNFTTGKTGDITNQQLDASWLLLFETDGAQYTVSYRGLRYVFESNQEIKFFYDSEQKIYDNKTGQIVKDRIEVLSINTVPDAITPFTIDYPWQITKEYRDPEGYIDSKKVEVGFFDRDDDSVVDDPDTFNVLIAPETNINSKFVFLKKYITSDNIEDFKYVDNEVEKITVVTNDSFIQTSGMPTGKVFYVVKTDVFKKYDATTLLLTQTTDYKAFTGRDKLKFHYVHTADDDARIDPSSSNINDCYLLTKTYDTNFRQYLSGVTASLPLPPSSDNLFNSYGAEINKIKSISDELIYHPVKYKVLFGDKSETNMQATFKIVKNPEQVVNDNDIKSKVINAVNQFFALENWDFGDTFYFTELSTFVMNAVSPDLVSLIIVPKQTGQAFGSLFEIRSEADEIFISGASVDDVQVIDAITASRIQATGNVVTASSTSTTSGITSGTTYSSSSSY